MFAFVTMIRTLKRKAAPSVKWLRKETAPLPPQSGRGQVQSKHLNQRQEAARLRQAWYQVATARFVDWRLSLGHHPAPRGRGKRGRQAKSKEIQRRQTKREIQERKLIQEKRDRDTRSKRGERKKEKSWAREAREIREGREASRREKREEARAKQ
jgi:hypothetical protein